MARISILATAALFAVLALSPGLSRAEFPDDLFPLTSRTFEGAVGGFGYSGTTIEGGIETAVSGSLSFSPGGAVPANSVLSDLLYENYPYKGFLNIAFIEFYRNGDPDILDGLVCLQNRPRSYTGKDQFFGHIRNEQLLAGHALMSAVVFLDGTVNLLDVVPDTDGTPLFSYTGTGNVLLIQGAVLYKGKVKQKNGAVMEGYKFLAAPTEAGRAYVSGGALLEDTWRPVYLRKMKLSAGKFELVDEEYIIAP